MQAQASAVVTDLIKKKIVNEALSETYLCTCCKANNDTCYSKVLHLGQETVSEIWMKS